MDSAPGNVLVVYALAQYPVRETVRDHLYCFQRYSAHRCFYVNLSLRDLPDSLLRLEFDAVIFHTTFLSMRWTPAAFARLRDRVQPVKRLDGTRIAIPQDEFLESTALCEFINEFEIDHVFTAASESEWSKIYATVDPTRVCFTTVLTGYLEDRSVNRMTRVTSDVPARSVDIGYRAWRAAPWLGRHGLLKAEIADAFTRAGKARGLSVDISTRDEDTLYGDDWYRLLASSKYTIGVEGGASVLDPDGSIRASTERYIAAHPHASFEDIEANCFPRQDGTLRLFAMSPRHLEACATRTCQILVEGAYNGVLQPGVHYIELRRDLGNLDEVLDHVARDDLRHEITANAWRDIVGSGRYTYSGFVDEIERLAIPAAAASRATPVSLRWLMAALDRLTWIELAVRKGVGPAISIRLAAALKAVLPDSAVDALRRRLASE